MSIWDKIEDLFKTKEEIADEEAQRAGAAVEGETTSGLVDALKNLEDELNKIRLKNRTTTSCFPR